MSLHHCYLTCTNITVLIMTSCSVWLTLKTFCLSHYWACFISFLIFCLKPGRWKRDESLFSISKQLRNSCLRQICSSSCTSVNSVIHPCFANEAFRLHTCTFLSRPQVCLFNNHSEDTDGDECKNLPQCWQLHRFTFSTHWATRPCRRVKWQR